MPESGGVIVEVAMWQDQRIVAFGAAQWRLEPDIKWVLDIERAPYPSGALVDFQDINEPTPTCGWFWRERVWRFEIDEAARNYDGEALWFMLFRYDPGECADVC